MASNYLAVPAQPGDSSRDSVKQRVIEAAGPPCRLSSPRSSPCGLHHGDPAEIHCQADEVPLARLLAQAPQTEGSETEHAFHPPEDGFDDALSLSISRAATLGGELPLHRSSAG